MQNNLHLKNCVVKRFFVRFFRVFFRIRGNNFLWGLIEGQLCGGEIGNEGWQSRFSGPPYPAPPLQYQASPPPTESRLDNENDNHYHNAINA
jgi:hypothetical protein